MILLTLSGTSSPICAPCASRVAASIAILSQWVKTFFINQRQLRLDGPAIERQAHRSEGAPVMYGDALPADRLVVLGRAVAGIRRPAITIVAPGERPHD